MQNNDQLEKHRSKKEDLLLYESSVATIIALIKEGKTDRELIEVYAYPEHWIKKKVKSEPDYKEAKVVRRWTGLIGVNSPLNGLSTADLEKKLTVDLLLGLTGIDIARKYKVKENNLRGYLKYRGIDLMALKRKAAVLLENTVKAKIKEGASLEDVSLELGISIEILKRKNIVYVPKENGHIDKRRKLLKQLLVDFEKEKPIGKFDSLEGYIVYKLANGYTLTSLAARYEVTRDKLKTLLLEQGISKDVLKRKPKPPKAPKQPKERIFKLITEGVEQNVPLSAFIALVIGKIEEGLVPVAIAKELGVTSAVIYSNVASLPEYKKAYKKAKPMRDAVSKQDRASSSLAVEVELLLKQGFSIMAIADKVNRKHYSVTKILKSIGGYDDVLNAFWLERQSWRTGTPLSNDFLLGLIRDGHTLSWIWRTYKLDTAYVWEVLAKEEGYSEAVARGKQIREERRMTTFTPPLKTSKLTILLGLELLRRGMTKSSIANSGLVSLYALQNVVTKEDAYKECMEENKKAREQIAVELSKRSKKVRNKAVSEVVNSLVLADLDEIRENVNRKLQ